MKKIYKIDLKQDENGKYSMKKTTKGFEPVELLGILDCLQTQIMQEMKKNKSVPV